MGNETEIKKVDRKFASAATLLVNEKDEKKVPVDVRDLYKYYKNLIITEEGIAKSIVPWVSETGIYEKYLKHIRGIGPILSANLIAMLNPITDFPKPSMLISYAGLSGSHYEQECKEGHKFITASPKPSCPVNMSETTDEIKPCGAEIIKSEFLNTPMKRKTGYHIFINSRLKTTLFKIAASFEKQSPKLAQYRLLYDMKKAEYASRKELQDEKGGKGHIRMMAFRYIEKRFLVNLHVAWMQGLGYEVTPYEATMPGHHIDPIRVDDDYPLPAKGSIETISERRMWAIRQLSNNYYDIQKMRIKCFNNIVAWIKSNPNKAKDYLKMDKEKESESEIVV